MFKQHIKYHLTDLDCKMANGTQSDGERKRESRAGSYGMHRLLVVCLAPLKLLTDKQTNLFKSNHLHCSNYFVPFSQ